MGTLLQWMEHKFGGGPGGPKRKNTLLWVIMVGLLGAALMIINAFINVKDLDPINTGRASPPAESKETFAGSASKENASFHDYEQAYGDQLKGILQQIVGVGEVEVLVTIESTEEMTVDKNYNDNQTMTTERDNGGATRNISQVTRSGEVVIYQVSGDQKPLVLKYIKPKIRGVIVVAKGAENLTVKKMIMEAVERGMDVQASKISILPRKTGN
ncbi:MULTISPECIES: stage III sporulation protein AG [unclassified Paenibacillus]|uniref:stage III sporulation protein AG n=1 Tax=unclassified Paenibacillus TaxID=185978 RepID=UPI0006FB94E8|nr:MULTISPECIES: stage III sporulation protein AG [unclassified Paenibacillus]KRE69379.1 stage III sporulation protein AG [Paenibacillus sp. Soil750]KRE98307.1 stage III sporulation protein AG [Paenibacillus sp. Soil766]